MGLPTNMANAIYRDPGVEHYRGNPLIEALPPIMTTKQIKQALSGSIKFDLGDIYTDGTHRVHIISQLLDDFFQPLANHLQLESKISIMIRQGYVGRNLGDGSLNTHLQNGYERVMTGELEVFRFEHVRSTARSLSLIGCSGSGKSSTLNRILATYPQVIFHEKYNFTQIVYLKLDCPLDGSLKNLCNHFFRAVDIALNTDYEKKYALKRHTVETLMALMSQIANVHSIGVLAIDEIQHLSTSKSGGIEKMLNFFVTLVNVIGLPVVMVGTPKARAIFEMDLRSARRSAGFGSLFWEPMKAPSPNADKDQIKKAEWGAFTDKLWQYQWLQKRDEVLTEEMRNCWYDLSQGVLDIVVKLFVLAQLRAIVTRTERVTPKLMKKVYDDELKPVHPMLAALRSGDPEMIVKYSDLSIPDIDKKILELSAKIDSVQAGAELQRYSSNEQAMRLYNLLVAMDCDSDLIEPLIERAFSLYPKISVRELMPIVLEWYGLEEKEPKKPQNKPTVIKPPEWHTLDSGDLRFKFSQCGKGQSVYHELKRSEVIFDVVFWLRNAS
ncbi:MAG: AAA family ATPase [Methylobacter sp.]|uniref:AAA family ATPase n=1 Tax=Methylobacter sp. TaxID=2051955 RepID=UPI002731897D|nr:AAA family ATPase [Methylobacter sp.]MDP1664236.1 AAA family ATPase [Methylobacter sp.]